MHGAGGGCQGGMRGVAGGKSLAECVLQSESKAGTVRSDE